MRAAYSALIIQPRRPAQINTHNDRMSAYSFLRSSRCRSSKTVTSTFSSTVIGFFACSVFASAMSTPCSLPLSPASAITRATAHPATSAVENAARQRTQRIHMRQLSARNPAAIRVGRCVWLCIGRTRKNARTVASADFFHLSLAGWAVPAPVAPFRATGDNGVRRSLPSHLIILRRVDTPFFCFPCHAFAPRPHRQQRRCVP